MDDNPPFIIAIAECGSINKAARKMHISQPALSQRLKQVEAHLGVPLFERGRAVIKPTRAGESYLAWARAAVEAESLMRRDIAAIADNSSRQLHVGTSVPRAASLLPQVIERFVALREGCSVVLHEAAMPETQTRLLSSGEIDFSIFIPTPPEATLFVSEPICTETMMLVAPRDMVGDRFSVVDGQKVVSPALVASVPVVMPPGNLKHSRLVESLAKAANIKLAPILRSCSNDLTLEMMERGLGATIMPNTFVPASWEGRFELFRIEGFSHTGSLYYSRLESHETSEDERVFVRIAREAVG